jgi:hypothetical protein
VSVVREATIRAAYLLAVLAYSIYLPDPLAQLREGGELHVHLALQLACLLTQLLPLARTTVAGASGA